MPKMKTHKATQKRFYLTGRGKIMRRQAGQDHFNARESGVTTKRKRKDVLAPKMFQKTIRKLII